MLRWFRDHWEIKLIAFIMAVTVYVFTGSLIRVDTMVTVRIENQHVHGLPEDYRVRAISPRDLTVEISGPRNLVAEIDEEAIAARLQFSRGNLDAGRQHFDVTARLLQLPPELRLHYVGSERVEVLVDRVVRRSLNLSVEPEDFVLGTPGLVVRRVQVDHTHVSLEGPKQVIDELRERGSLRIVQEVLTDVPADLTEPREFTVPVNVAIDEELQVLNEGAITATVTVEPVPDERHLTLPVAVLAPMGFMEGYSVELHQQEVALTVTGPRNRLDNLKSERDIRAYVDLSGGLTLDIPKTHPVRVVAPAWATVSSAQVKLTVRARSGAGQAPPPTDDPGLDQPGPPLPETSPVEGQPGPPLPSPSPSPAP